MKILKIRFKNLNSLEGEWELDFSHPAYESNGVFAITGPTGAGKTTLLDAICLGLYGRTPRLKIVSKSVNEVMTRQTGDCFAEVIFATLKGTFRCHWSHHRARKNPHGDLQQPRHEIVDHKSNVVLENRIKNVAVAVEDVIGMSFDQFTRSIMLAQGSFAAFLQASADDRAPLLEQITGTEIYSRISQKVHQYTAEQQKQYTLRAAEIDNLAILPEDEKTILQNEVTLKLGESEKLRSRITTLQKSIAWREHIEKIKEEILKLENDFSKTQEHLENQKSQRILLQRAKTASLHVMNHHHLQRLHTLQKEEIIESNQIKNELSGLQEKIQTLSREKDKAIQLFKKTEKDLENERKTASQVRTLDAQIQDRTEQYEDENEKFSRICHQIEEIKSHITDLSAHLIQTDKEYANYLNYVKEHQVDSGLVETLAVFNEKYGHLQVELSNREKIHKHLQDIQSRISETSDEIEKAKQVYDQSLQNHKNAAEQYLSVTHEISIIRESHPSLYIQQEQHAQRLSQLERLSLLYDEKQKTTTEADHLQQQTKALSKERGTAEKEEQSLIEKYSAQEKLVNQQEEIYILSQRIKSYEEERVELRSGSPCPLCGATHHPFAEEAPSLTNESSKKLQEEKRHLVSLQKRITELQTQAAFNLKQHSANLQRNKELEQTIDKLNKQISELCQIQGFEISEQLAEILHKEIDFEQEKLSELAKNHAKLEKLEARAADLRKQIEVLKDDLVSKERTINSEKMRLENLSEKGSEQKEELKDLNKSIDDDIQKFTAKLAPFGFSHHEQVDFSSILQELELRRKKWLEAKDKEHILLEKRRLQENTQQKEQVKLEATVNEQQRLRQSIGIKEKGLADLNQKRRDLYDSKDPDSEEQKHSEQYSEVLKLRDTIAECLRDHENKIILLSDKLERLSNSTENRAEQLDDEQQKFIETLNKEGFLDIDQFTTAIMSDERINELESLFKDLDEHYSRQKTLLEEKRKLISSELAKNLSNENLVTLNYQLIEKNDRLNMVVQEIGRLQGKLEDNDKLLSKQRQKKRDLLEQEKELQRWQKLDGLIGSASGKKFRNFAQGITFEIMIDLANKNLQKMTDRYILRRDNTHPLDLQVMDNYRAGDTRSTQNLSGGESFLVSLALALGLSNMAGNSVRVDSFFLDEGFGTLDEETLDTALQTLAGLQQEGKMIGIISHVSLLKERLDTQIRLVPRTGGHSIIKGPGVRAL